MDENKVNADKLPDDVDRDSDRRSLDDILSRLKDVENASTVHRRPRPWFRTSSNLISLFAVAVSVAIFVTTFLSGSKETQFQKLQQFGQVIDQISALGGKEVDVYRMDLPPAIRAGAFMMIANRRVALLNQADRLLADVGDDQVSKLDLALLAPAYLSIGRQKDAEKYYLALAHAKEEPLLVQVMGWRSLIALYSHFGREHLGDAREAAEQGLALIKNADNDIVLKREAIMIPYTTCAQLCDGTQLRRSAPLSIDGRTQCQGTAL